MPDVMKLRSMRERTGANALSAVPIVAGLAVGVLLGALIIPATQESTEVAVSADDADGPEGTRSTEDGGDATSAGGGDQGGSEASGPGGGQGASGPLDDATSPGGEVLAGEGDAPGAEDGAPGPDGGSEDTGVRGVTEDMVRIGVAYPDLAAFEQVSEDFAVGDQEEQMEAVLAAWRRDGLVPVHGRDVEFIFREFDIFSSDEKIAACNAFVKDDEVFAVIAGRFFDEGSECVAERFETPLITPNSAPESLYERTAPFYFTLRPPWEHLFRNWMHWADTGGHLEGKTIGLFYESEVRGPVTTGIKDELAARGYEIAAEVEGEGAGVGTSQDQLAVQQFRQNGVDLALLVVGGTSAINFMNFAESQAYRPTYIDTDFSEHTTDAAASAYPPNQYHGTLAMTATRVGEISAGMPVPPATGKCVSDYEEYSGEDVRPEGRETAEYNSVVISCDMANPMLQALIGAGRELTPGGLVDAFEGIEGTSLAAHGDLSFGPGRHHGVSQQRTVEWTRECECWKARGSFEPFAL